MPQVAGAPSLDNFQVYVLALIDLSVLRICHKQLPAIFPPQIPQNRSF